MENKTARKPKLKDMLNIAKKVKNWRKLPPHFSAGISHSTYNFYEGDISNIKINVGDMYHFDEGQQVYRIDVMRGETYLYSNAIIGEHEGFEDLVHVILMHTDSNYRQGHSEIEMVLENAVKGGL